MTTHPPGHRMNVSMPREFQEKVREAAGKASAAEGRWITMAEFIREAITEKLEREANG